MDVPKPCGDPDTTGDFDPFDQVTLRRVRDGEGEPTALVVIEGLRDGGAREIRVRYEQLWKQAEIHLQWRHGKTMADAMTPAELVHATVRAAVAFLMD